MLVATDQLCFSLLCLYLAETISSSYGRKWSQVSVTEIQIMTVAPVKCVVDDVLFS